jgi:hypothetical protein
MIDCLIYVECLQGNSNLTHWALILVTAKPKQANKHSQEIKERRKSHCLRQVKRARELFPKPCPLWTKEPWGFNSHTYSYRKAL